MLDSYTQVEDIKIFGEIHSQVSVKDIESIQPDISTQMHLVRHYASLDKKNLDSLLGKSYTYFDSQSNHFCNNVVREEDVYEALKAKGSKFYLSESLVATPLRVIDTIKTLGSKRAERGELAWIKKKDQLICLFTLSFEKLIGECGLAKLSELPISLRNSVIEVQRGSSPTDSYFIMAVIAPMVPTNNMVVQLKKSESGVIVDTAFPGIMAVDRPDIESQSKEEYEYNKWFWDNHVFLISDSD